MTRRKKRRGPAFLPLLAGILIGGAAVWLLLGRPGTPRVERPSPAPAATAAPSPPPTAPPAPATPVPAIPADFEPATSAPAGGVLAIVLDDLGWDAGAVRAVGALPGPVGLAVIPSAPHAAEAAALARSRGWDLLVHLPMSREDGAHEADAVGPGDDDAAIAARVGRALERVPGAIGLNNHQGSEATADARVVRAVLSVVRDRGLFFLDSRTTAATVAEREARALGVSTIARDVFLDDAGVAAREGAEQALRGAWKSALETAARKGQCVVIGHPHEATLAFLSARLRAKGAPRLVKVSELVD